MDTLQPQPLALRACGIFLVCLLFGLLVVSRARADVGVQPILPGGSDISPEEETPIQMAAETVVMSVRSETEADNAAIQLNPEAYGYQSQSAWFSAVADVQVDFTMKNPTSEAVSMTTWFPLASVLKTHGWDEVSLEEVVPRIAGFQVSVDGDPVDYEISELPNPNGADKPALPWASFPVTFPAGKETMIHVSYVLPLSQLPKSNVLALYYIFQTGAGWAGPIGQAELILNLPYPASEETLAGIPKGSLNPPYFVYLGDEATDLPPGAALEGNQARWTWKDFEPGPEDDFSIVVLSPKSWNDLQAVRDAVETNPDDGQAWLNLCLTYYGRSQNWRGAIPLGYSESYQNLGAEACQEAARLLPGDAAPHYVLAGIYLSALRENPSLKTLKPVWVELKIGQKLEAIQPMSEMVLRDCWDYSTNSECIEAIIADIFPAKPNPEWDSSVSEYLANAVNRLAENATATTEWSAQSTNWAAETATVETTLRIKPTATTTPTQKPTLTLTLEPSATSQPSPTTTASVAATGGGQGMLLGAVIVIVLVIAGFLVARRFRNGAG